jgi:predicted transcriptional regulator
MLAEARQLSLFNDLSVMDNLVDKFKMLVSKYIRRGKKNFFAVVEHLRKFSCKTRGVSFCKVSTMAEALGISERTVQRIITRLVDLGLVKRVTMIDQKTGAQWPNCYQLQSQIDWNHVVESLAPDLVAITEELPADRSVTQEVTQDDIQNVTPSTGDNPIKHNRSWTVPTWGSFSNAFKSSKNIYEFKEDMNQISFPFFYWLENGNEDVHTQPDPTPKHANAPKTAPYADHPWFDVLLGK